MKGGRKGEKERGGREGRKDGSSKEGGREGREEKQGEREKEGREEKVGNGDLKLGKPFYDYFPLHICVFCFCSNNVICAKAFSSMVILCVSINKHWEIQAFRGQKAEVKSSITSPGFCLVPETGHP